MPYEVCSGIKIDADISRVGLLEYVRAVKEAIVNLQARQAYLSEINLPSLIDTSILMEASAICDQVLMHLENSALSDEQLANKLQLILKQRWENIRTTQLSYTYCYKSEVTKPLIVIANWLYQIDNTKKRYQYLMPSICEHVDILGCEDDIDDYPLGTVIISDDGKSLIPIELLTIYFKTDNNMLLNQLCKPYSSSDSTCPDGLTAAEQKALIYHNINTLNFYRAYYALSEFKNNGKTLGAQIRLLINALELGGASEQGNESDASQISYDGIEAFLKCWSHLSDEQQQACGRLEDVSGKYTFANTLDILIEGETKGFTCVEVNANRLNLILDNNPELFKISITNGDESTKEKNDDGIDDYLGVFIKWQEKLSNNMYGAQANSKLVNGYCFEYITSMQRVKLAQLSGFDICKEYGQHALKIMKELLDKYDLSPLTLLCTNSKDMDQSLFATYLFMNERGFFYSLIAKLDSYKNIITAMVLQDIVRMQDLNNKHEFIQQILDSYASAEMFLITDHAEYLPAAQLDSTKRQMYFTGGRTLLHDAMRSTSIDIALMMLEKYHEQIIIEIKCGGKKRNTLHWLASTEWDNNVEICQQIFSYCFNQFVLLDSDIDENTPMHLAAMYGNHIMMQIILDYEQLPIELFVKTNASGMTMLMLATYADDTSVLDLLISDSRVITALNEKGNDGIKMLYATNKLQETLLHRAARIGHLGLAQLVLELDKDKRLIKTYDSKGLNPLQCICAADLQVTGQVDKLISLLLEYTDSIKEVNNVDIDSSALNVVIKSKAPIHKLKLFKSWRGFNDGLYAGRLAHLLQFITGQLSCSDSVLEQKYKIDDDLVLTVDEDNSTTINIPTVSSFDRLCQDVASDNDDEAVNFQYLLALSRTIGLLDYLYEHNFKLTVPVEYIGKLHMIFNVVCKFDFQRVEFDNNHYNTLYFLVMAKHIKLIREHANSEKLVKMLTEYEDYSQSPLWLAMGLGQIETVKIFLSTLVKHHDFSGTYKIIRQMLSDVIVTCFSIDDDELIKIAEILIHIAQENENKKPSCTDYDLANNISKEPMPLILDSKDSNTTRISELTYLESLAKNVYSKLIRLAIDGKIQSVLTKQGIDKGLVSLNSYLTLETCLDEIKQFSKDYIDERQRESANISEQCVIDILNLLLINCRNRLINKKSEILISRELFDTIKSIMKKMSHIPTVIDYLNDFITKLPTQYHTLLTLSYVAAIEYKCYDQSLTNKYLHCVIDHLSKQTKEALDEVFTAFCYLANIQRTIPFSKKSNYYLDKYLDITTEHFVEFICCANNPSNLVERLSVYCIELIAKSSYMNRIKQSVGEQTVIDIWITASDYDSDFKHEALDSLVDDLIIDVMEKRLLPVRSPIYPAFTESISKYIQCSIIEYFALIGYIPRRYVDLLNYKALTNSIDITFHQQREQENDVYNAERFNIISLLLEKKKISVIVDLLYAGYILSKDEVDILTKLYLEQELVLVNFRTHSGKAHPFANELESIQRKLNSRSRLYTIYDQERIQQLLQALCLPTNRYVVQEQVLVYGMPIPYEPKSNNFIDTNPIDIPAIVQKCGIASTIDELLEKYYIAYYDDSTQLGVKVFKETNSKYMSLDNFSEYNARLYFMDFINNLRGESLKVCSLYCYLSSHGKPPTASTWLPKKNNHDLVQMLNTYLRRINTTQFRGFTYFILSLLKFVILKNDLYTSTKSLRNIVKNIDDKLSLIQLTFSDYIDYYLQLARYHKRTPLESIYAPSSGGFPMHLDSILEQLFCKFKAQKNMPNIKFSIINKIMLIQNDSYNDIYPKDMQALLHCLEDLLQILAASNEQETCTSTHDTACTYTLVGNSMPIESSADSQQDHNDELKEGYDSINEEQSVNTNARPTHSDEVNCSEQGDDDFALMKCR